MHWCAAQSETQLWESTPEVIYKACGTLRLPQLSLHNAEPCCVGTSLCCSSGENLLHNDEEKLKKNLIYPEIMFFFVLLKSQFFMSYQETFFARCSQKEKTVSSKKHSHVK